MNVQSCSPGTPPLKCTCMKGRWNPECPQHPPQLVGWAFPDQVKP